MQSHPPPAQRPWQFFNVGPGREQYSEVKQSLSEVQDAPQQNAASGPPPPTVDPRWHLKPGYQFEIHSSIRSMVGRTRDQIVTPGLVPQLSGPRLTRLKTPETSCTFLGFASRGR